MTVESTDYERWVPILTADTISVCFSKDVRFFMSCMPQYSDVGLSIDLLQTNSSVEEKENRSKCIRRGNSGIILAFIAGISSIFLVPIPLSATQHNTTLDYNIRDQRFACRDRAVFYPPPFVYRASWRSL